MKLSALVDSARFVGDDPVINHLTADSRAVKSGSLFAALPGTALDGRDFIPEALANGASAILSLPGLPELPVPAIGSERPRKEYAQIAARLYPGQPRALAAITGTNGKSSTAEFLRQIWAFAGLDAACFGTLGVTSSEGVQPLSHTTPDAAALHQTLCGLAARGITHAAMEASSHGLLQYRMDGVKVSAVAFTNLTQDHFDYHDTMDDYFAAKARLFLELAPTGIPAIVNVDGEYGRKMAAIAREAKLDVCTVGWRGGDIQIAEVTPGRAGQRAVFIYRGKRVCCELPLAGEFQILNAMTAIGLAIATGVAPETAFAALGSLTGVPGRMEKAGETKDGAPVFVDFAHTPDGLEKLLRGLRPHTQGQIILVFGCGGDRDPDKRPKMGAIACQFADHAIVTDDNPRSEDAARIRKAVMKGCPDADEVGDRAAAIAHGISLLGAGDCLVIAGKGHESGQIIGDTIIPFKDQDAARAALKAAA